MWEIDAIEVRPLTVTGLFKGIVQNFITMTWWRFLYTLFLLGLLKTPEGEWMSLRHFSLHNLLQRIKIRAKQI